MEVVIVSESLAKRHWPNGDAIGQRVSTNDGKSWNTVVGVVGDVRQYGLNRPPTDTLYGPMLQNAPLSAVLLIHTNSDPRQMTHSIVAAVHEVDAQQPVVHVRTLDEVHDEWLASPRLTATLVALFASLALIITLAGISGVTALAVSQRTREIGIRMALGATRGRVLRMVVGEGLLMVMLGLIFGAGSAPLVTRPMADLLFGVKATDPATYLTVAGLVLAVAATACFVPSRRAASVDPLRALRSE